MKINENNLRNVDAAYGDEATFTYDDINTMIARPQVAAKKPFVKAHPAITALIAAVLLASPIAGFTSATLMSHASTSSSKVSGAALTAEYARTHEKANTTRKEEVAVKKTIPFSVKGPGHIGAVANCSISNNEIIFSNSQHDAAIKMVADVNGASAELKIDGQVVANGDESVILKANANYGKIEAVFVDKIAEDKAAQEAAAKKASDEKAAQEAASKKAEDEKVAQEVSSQNIQEAFTPVASEPVYYEAPVAEPVYYEAPAAEPVYEESPAAEPVYYEAPAAEPVHYEAPAVAQSAPAADVPNSGMPQNGMNSKERAVAEDIFNTYNDWRAARGLNRVAWSEDCANMAWGSVTGCASIKDLVHRLGIPAHLQTTYSDILQYSTWKQTGTEAVEYWEDSTGHRRMMQCDSAEVAGVAAYDIDGIWYYAIVYNFHGCNQSGQ